MLASKRSVMNILNKKTMHINLKSTLRPLIIGTFITCFSQLSFGQNEDHLIKYSDIDFQGSARFMGMGGSMGAFGGDISAGTVNPASLGSIEENYVGASVLDNFRLNKTSYNGTLTANGSNSFKLPSGGIIVAEDKSEGENGIMFQQIAVSFNGYKSFHENLKYSGENFYSLLEVFAAHGAGIDPLDIYFQRPFTTAMAYEVFALDYDVTTQNYVPRLNNGDMFHEREVRTRGGIGEGSIGYSVNYSHTFLLGASANFRFIRHVEHIEHHETLTDTSDVSLRSIRYDHTTSTRGFGGNVKIGGIYTPNNTVKIGLAYHTPSYMAMRDSLYSDMKGNHSFGTYDVQDDFEPFAIYHYRHRTPQKLVGSFAYKSFTETFGINVDAEYSNYAKSRFKRSILNANDDYTFSDVNERMDTTYAPVVNFRVGAEVQVVPDIFVRAGYGLYPNPLKARESFFDSPRQFFSGGFGFKIQDFVIDLAYRNTSYSSEYYAFDPSKIENLVTIKTSDHSIVLTVSGRF